MNTMLHTLKVPRYTGVLLGDLSAHIMASLKRLHLHTIVFAALGVLLTMGVWFMDRLRKSDAMLNFEG